MKRIIFLVIAGLLLTQAAMAQHMVPEDKIRFSESRGFDYDPALDAVFYNGYTNGQVVKLGDLHGNSWFLGNMSLGSSTYSSEYKLHVTGKVFVSDQLNTNKLFVTGNKIRFSEWRGFDYDPALDAIFYNGYNNGQVVKLGDINGNGWFKGSLGIGTTDTFGYRLAVNGTIGSKEVVVEVTSPWPDFIFEDNYKLRTLEEVENYITVNKHLPEMPSEADVSENGINLGKMDAKFLMKIEELTLYLIEMNKRMSQLELENAELKKEVSTLKNE